MSMTPVTCEHTYILNAIFYLKKIFFIKDKLNIIKSEKNNKKQRPIQFRENLLEGEIGTWWKSLIP